MSSVASLRQIRRRIRSVENTQKITRAMEMVAAAKLRRFQDLLGSARPYTERLEELLDRLLEKLPPGYRHPYLGAEGTFSGRPENVAGGDFPPSDQLILVLFTSDTGLCGTYNRAVEEEAREWLSREGAGETPCDFIFVGKHGARAFHKEKGKVRGTFSDLRVSRIPEILEGLRKMLESAVLNSGGGAVYAAYTRMESLARYHPAVEKILPKRGGVTTRAGLPQPGTPSRPYAALEEGNASFIEFLVEPDPKTVLDRLLPAFFEARLGFIFYHALLTEQIARMTAMRQATQNAEEMIDELTLLRNKARQAAITKEIIEVVSGSRALRLK